MGCDISRFESILIFRPLMPAFSPAIYLTARPDLGDVSQGKTRGLQQTRAS